MSSAEIFTQHAKCQYQRDYFQIVGLNTPLKMDTLVLMDDPQPIITLFLSVVTKVMFCMEPLTPLALMTELGPKQVLALLKVSVFA